MKLYFINIFEGNGKGKEFKRFEKNLIQYIYSS